MAGRTTLQDIANFCGLSKSMVAQVMRDPEGCSATAKTRSAIVTAARQLNYRPNHAARSLSTNKTCTIGVVMPAVGGFYYELAIALERIFTEHGYYSLFSYWTVTDVTRDESMRCFDRIVEHGVDGIVTVQYNEVLADLGIPVVTYGNERRLMDCVYPDKVGSLNQAVDYLMAHGHRGIGFMGLDEDVRGLSIRGILRDHGFTVHPEWIASSYTLYQDGYDSMKKIHASGTLPTAIITHSDLMAIGAMKYAHEAGIGIPEDLSIISYDNLTQAAYTVPALTSFDQCYEKAASLLVKAMMNRIENPGMAQQKYPIPLPLVERDSVKTIRPEPGQVG